MPNETLPAQCPQPVPHEEGSADWQQVDKLRVQQHVLHQVDVDAAKHYVEGQQAESDGGAAPQHIEEFPGMGGSREWSCHAPALSRSIVLPGEQVATEAAR